MQKILKSTLVYWLLVLILGLSLVFIFFRLRYPQYLAGQIPLFDFDAYYGNIVEVVRHNQHPFAFEGMQTLGPPLVLIPYIPFSYVSQPTARGVITLINLICLSLTAHFLSLHLTPRLPILGTLLFLLILILPFPTRFTIEMGQTNLITMLLITLLLTRIKASGFLAGLLPIIKTNYIFVLVSLVRNKRLVLQALLVMCLSIILGFMWIKPQYYLDYVNDKFLSVVNDPGTPQSIDYYNQSLRATLARLYLSPTYTPIAILLTLSGTIYLLATSNIALAIMLSLIASPVVWSHYVVVTYPLLIILLWHTQKRPVHLVILGIIALLLSIEMPHLHTAPATFSNSLLGSHYFWGIVSLTLYLVAKNDKHPVQNLVKYVGKMPL